MKNQQQSIDKNTKERRSSILKNKNRTSLLKSTKAHAEADTVGGSTVKFKINDIQVNNFQQNYIENNPIHTEDRTIYDKIEIKINKQKQINYDQNALVRDINYINSIYNNVLVLATTQHKKEQNQTKNSNILKLESNIQKIIKQNIKIKEEVNSSYEKMKDLQIFAVYLNKNLEQLIENNEVTKFINQYEQTQRKLELLNKQILSSNSFGQNYKMSRKNNMAAGQTIYEKEQKCRKIREMIEKQKLRIKKLQNEQGSLIQHLYDVQNQLRKVQNLTVNLQMKIKQLESEKSYKSYKKIKKNNQLINQVSKFNRSKSVTKFNKQLNKENSVVQKNRKFLNRTDQLKSGLSMKKILQAKNN